MQLAPGAAAAGVDYNYVHYTGMLGCVCPLGGAVWPILPAGSPSPTRTHFFRPPISFLRPFHIPFFLPPRTPQGDLQ